jgi:hypothetical protein
VNEHTTFFVLIIISVFLLSTISGCSEDDEIGRKEKWVEAEAKIIADRFREEKLSECLLTIRNDAEAYVDSLIAGNDLLSQIIDESIPNRPIKPEYIDLDTVALQDHRVNPVLKND